jgi:hypothetical protein
MPKFEIDLSLNTLRVQIGDSRTGSLSHCDVEQSSGAPEALSAGKGMFATENIASGEAIFVIQDPMSVVLENQYLDNFCSYCLKFRFTPGVNLKSCGKCSKVKYCSQVRKIFNIATRTFS